MIYHLKLVIVLHYHKHFPLHNVSVVTLYYLLSPIYYYYYYIYSIDGGDWRIDLQPKDCLEPMIPYDIYQAKREAVYRLLDNWSAIVLFTTRPYSEQRNAAGVSAPLAGK
jgi:hypothetical protein